MRYQTLYGALCTTLLGVGEVGLGFTAIPLERYFDISHQVYWERKVERGRGCRLSSAYTLTWSVCDCKRHSCMHCPQTHAATRLPFWTTNPDYIGIVFFCPRCPPPSLAGKCFFPLGTPDHVQRASKQLNTTPLLRWLLEPPPTQGNYVSC